MLPGVNERANILLHSGCNQLRLNRVKVDHALSPN